MRKYFINIAINSVLFSVFFVSCKNNQQELLSKKWKSVHLENNKMNEEINSMKIYIDTLGENDPDLRKQINVDSLKSILNIQLENAVREQQMSLDNTMMDFKENGVVYTTSIQGVDSAMYHIDEDNHIVIEEQKLKGYGETMKFEILTLNSDTLLIKMIDYGDTSIVTMIPIKN